MATDLQAAFFLNHSLDPSGCGPPTEGHSCQTETWPPARILRPPPPNAVPLSQGGDGEQLLEVKISTMGAAPETASLPSPHSHHQLRVWIIYPASQGTERGQLTFPDLAAQDFTCIISFDLCKPYRRRSITQSPHITGKETEVLGDQTTSSKLQRKQMHLEPKAACHRSPDSSHSTLIPP